MKLKKVGSVITKVNIFKPIAFYLVILSLFLAPITTQASVGSVACSIFKLFCSVEADTEEASVNSQNMALLQAVISPDPSASTTKNEPVIVSGNSLSAESQITDSKTVDDEQISIYVVHNGDTLPAIAKMFNVSLNTIRWANDIKGNSIVPGQTLVILPISGVKHTVKSGETIQGIVKLHKGDLDEVLQYNNLSKNSKLAIGDDVFIPDGEAINITNSSGAKTTNKPSSSYPVYEGYFMRPIIGGLRTQGIHGHNGVDLASSYGAKIYAAADGDVLISKSSGWNGGYGSYVVIKHPNGTQTLYGHLSGTAVSAGQHVTQGQVIGYMGNSGQVTGVTGVHLHFEIRGARNPF